jgi:hypothetical protein
MENYEDMHIRNNGHGKVRHRENKRLELGGGQACDYLSD